MLESDIGALAIQNRSWWNYVGPGTTRFYLPFVPDIWS
ncbi:hypothetical protein OMCYN_01811 [cyanobiont of Ornithocercus magnificus]|nr:hypothetical protein OMCYN_01811 [cyanobiont of Ornithocercus magnificus]